jgi:hypothetical protein
MKNNQELARTNKNKPNQEEAKNTTMYPASGPSCGGNTPTAALAYSLISQVFTSTECSLSCIMNNGESSR